MRSLIGGALRTQAIYVVARLGVADHLSLGPRSADDLAQRTGVDADTLVRVLRYLVSNGVFVQDHGGRFALNRPAESLQTAHPRSLRPSAIRAGEDGWTLAAGLLDAVRTGRTPHETRFGKTFFERMSQTGGEAAFAGRVGATAAGIGEGIAALDCVARAQAIVDVGGGRGAVLTHLLGAHPHLRGVLVDREATIAGAQACVDEAGCRDRCQVIVADFFDRVPAGGDVYLLSWVLHDWDDEHAARILRACRLAARPGATLLVVEVMLPPRAEVSRPVASGAITDPYTLDLQMLLLTGGRERTEAEYRALLASAGFTAGNASPLGSARGASVIQAIAGQSRDGYE